MRKEKSNGKITATILVVVMLLTTLAVYTPTSMAATEAAIGQAIDLGMQWLAAQQNIDGSWGTIDQVAKTGFAVSKFETHAVGLEEDPLDPVYEYYDQVRNGLDYIFANVSIMSIGMQPAGNPDTDGDDIGVHWSNFTYYTSIAMMAIAASTHPEMVVDVLGSSVYGWTYEEVVQDAVDYFAFGQNDAGSERGGWGYEANFVGWSDNSNTGYAALGLAYAEAASPYGFGIAIPPFVKSELNIWIDYIQNDPGPLDDGGEVDPDGGSGYIAPNEMVNILKTGHLLAEMAFVGDATSDPRVVNATDYIVRHWNDPDEDPGWKGQLDPVTPPFISPASYQAMYATMTGLEAFGMVAIDGIDWFDEFSDVLVAQQNPDGSWPSCLFDDGEQILATEWALLTLEKAITQPRYGYWTIRAPIPTAREGYGAAEVNGVFYYIAGCSFSGDTNITEAYDPWTNTWFSRASLPGVGRAELVAVSDGAYVYIVGGRSDETGSVLNELLRYDPVADTWDALAPMPTARATEHMAVYFDGLIFVVGGRLGTEPGGGSAFAKLEVYDIATDTWSTGTSMPQNLSDAATVQYGDGIYVFGGFNATGGMQDTVYIYDIASDAWTNGASMPTPLTNPVAGTSSHGIHIIGGFDGTTDNGTTTHYVYNPQSNSWSISISVPYPTTEVQGVTYEGNIHVVGGGIYGQGSTNDLHQVFTSVVHGVGITSVTPSKTVVGKNYPMIINVTVENQGDLPETFNVTAYYSNETLTSEQWETFWSMGDVNRDGYIDDLDGDLISAAIGSTPGDPDWNPDADLNQDGYVLVEDLSIWGLNYGLDIWTEFSILGGSIGRQTVTDLSPENSTTLVFVWDTTGILYGDYIISARATRVPGETDMTNNAYDDGWVRITIPGDIDGDYYVGSADAGVLNGAYGTWRGDPLYVPEADIDCDGYIGSADAGILNGSYGQSV